MLTVRPARVIAITRAEPDAVHLQVLAEGEDSPRTALAYPALTGPVALGDRVYLNTTATALDLGTGGIDFVMGPVTETGETPAPVSVFGDPDGTEHIVKLRYTPFQHAVRAIEMDPAYTDQWSGELTLGATPVVVCELHSQIAPVAAAIKAARPSARVAYVMTDSAALPLAFSRLVRDLKAASLLDATLTSGQAFGGDYECVTDASALLAARHVASADAIIIGQGPGNAGTGTCYGFSGLEQGMLMDLVAALEGTAFGVLRLSLADPRDRHHGLSHHTVTALGRIARSAGTVVFPACPEGVALAPYQTLRQAVYNSFLAARHRLEEADGSPGLALLRESGIRITSMGRGVDQDPLFFHAAAAAGAAATAWSA